MGDNHQNGSALAAAFSYRSIRDLLYYTPPGVTDPGDFGHIYDVAIDASISSLLGTAAYPDPNGDDTDVDGPGGPRMRDVLIGLSVARLAGGLSDREVGRSLQTNALESVARQVEQMQRGVR